MQQKEGFCCIAFSGPCGAAQAPSAPSLVDPLRAVHVVNQCYPSPVGAYTMSLQRDPSGDSQCD